MKIIFSRKGFDSGSDGVPSLILDGVSFSLPMPIAHRAVTTYADLWLAQAGEAATYQLDPNTCRIKGC
ncbi:MAG: hypothetical protein KDE63_07700 [Novosphingobium sp.]|uniref:Nmad3 family putative nucleotide modification protein n=1 Tax=Paracoccus sp. TaxID=267 RepID=UPI001D572128|nr:hypothetical protein [Novosphingobium sp.]